MTRWDWSHFPPTATNQSGLTNNPNQVINIISGLATINTTDIGDGIAYAQADFPTNLPAGTLPVMILLTDGLPNRLLKNRVIFG